MFSNQGRNQVAFYSETGDKYLASIPNLSAPSGLAVTDDTLYVAETNRHCVRSFRITRARTPNGAWADSVEIEARTIFQGFNIPIDVAVCRDDAHTVYVSNLGDNTVKELTSKATVWEVHRKWRCISSQR